MRVLKGVFSLSPFFSFLQEEREEVSCEMERIRFDQPSYTF